MHTHTMLFPSSAELSPFQLASAFVNELKEETGTLSGVNTTFNQGRTVLLSQETEMSEVKHTAYAA